MDISSWSKLPPVQTAPGKEPEPILDRINAARVKPPAAPMVEPFSDPPRAIPADSPAARAALLANLNAPATICPPSAPPGAVVLVSPPTADSQLQAAAAAVASLPPMEPPAKPAAYGRWTPAARLAVLQGLVAWLEDPSDDNLFMSEFLAAHELAESTLAGWEKAEPDGVVSQLLARARQAQLNKAIRLSGKRVEIGKNVTERWNPSVLRYFLELRGHVVQQRVDVTSGGKALDLLAIAVGPAALARIMQAEEAPAGDVVDAEYVESPPEPPAGQAPTAHRAC